MKLDKKNRIKSILFLTLGVLLSTGCKSTEEKAPESETKTEKKDDSTAKSGLTPEQAAKVVAKVGERTITVGDITEQINRLSPYIRRRWSAPEKRKEFLDNLIRVELLSQEADRLNLGVDSPEIDRVVNQVMIRLMIKNDLEKEIIPSEIDEATLQKTYEQEQDKYKRPPQVRASHIVLKSRAEAEKLIADLESNKNDNRYFREKAKTLSIDESTKERGGDLGYFSETGEKNGKDDEEVDPKVASAVWQLKSVGDIAKNPVETDAGFHVVKLTNRRPKLDRSFESVKRMIESRLLREKRRQALDKFVDDLKAKAKVEVFEENLAKIEVPTGSPMAGPTPQRMGPPAANPAQKKKKSHVPQKKAANKKAQ
jgi:peptidyl-prolyl cis-trans isomerase C